MSWKSVLFVIFFACLPTASIGQEPTGKILFVVTSHDTIPAINKPTGAYASEIIHPYQVLRAAGYEIDFVSPKGGKTPLDGVSELNSEDRKFLESDVFSRKLHTAMTPSQVDTKKYKAIFFAGGHGTMFDLPDHELLQRITATLYERGGVVAAVCHGPAALVNVKLSNGSYLVKGKQVAMFTNQEEAAVELTKAMPFLLETKLKERGAEITKAKNFQKHVAVSGRLVTGQNPASAEAVGEEIVSLLASS